MKRLHIVKRVILRYRSCKKHTAESQFGGMEHGREGGFRVRQKSSAALLRSRQINLLKSHSAGNFLQLDWICGCDDTESTSMPACMGKCDRDTEFDRDPVAAAAG